MKRTVVIGLGIVSSIGNNQQEVLTSLRKGCSEIAFSQELKDSGVRSRAWGNVRLDTTGLIGRKIVRFVNDVSVYAFLSMEQAIADAGLPPEAYQNNPHVGLTVGSGGGSSRFQAFDADAMHGPRSLKAIGPYVVTKAMASSVPTCLATSLEIHSVDYPTSSACVTSAYCIDNAIEWIQLGKQNIVLTSGGEKLRQGVACEFDAMDVLSTRYNDTPEKASRTYDAHHDGFVIAGGGGVVMVEELEYALTRGAHIYAETIGYGATSDGADMVAPSSGDAVRCMKMVIHGVDTPIDYLNSHDTSTPIGDVKELTAIREVFDDKSPAIFTTKVTAGYSLDVVGVQEAIHSLLILEYGFTASSINTEELDRQAAGLNIVTETTDCELTAAISNSFGFGGTNATLVMRRLKD